MRRSGLIDPFILALLLALWFVGTPASGYTYAVNSSLMLSRVQDQQGESNEIKDSLLTNFLFGILTPEGYFAGGKFLYHRSSSETSDGLDNFTDSLGSLGGSLGLISKKGFSVAGSILILPTRTIESSATHTYYGGTGWMVDLGYSVPVGKSSLGLQFSLGQIGFEKRTSDKDHEENLEGAHSISIAQPYLTAWIFL